MGAVRDPLSVHYDGIVSVLIRRAERASEQRRGVLVWVASPRGEYRARDRGGRTRHERAFTRAAYYPFFSKQGDMQGSGWHLKLTWGEQLKPSSAGKMARPCVVRLYRSYRQSDIDEPWLDGGQRSAE